LRNSYTAPTKKSVPVAGFKEAIVEKMPLEWGLGDAVEDFKEKGYEIVQDGPRRVRMRMPMEEFLKRENEIRKLADDRLKSTEGLGKVRVMEASEKQMAESLPDVGDLDE
jgi:hypothetical protein